MDMSIFISKLTIEELSELKEIVDSKLDKRLSEKGKWLWELGLSSRSYNILKGQNIRTIEDLANISASEFLKFRQGGPTSLRELSAQLKSFGLDWKRD